MKLLAIDYGRKNIGLAIAESNFAVPLSVFDIKSFKEAIKKVEEVVEKEDIKKIVIGVSDGEMAEETRQFGYKLSRKVNLPVVYQDETLSTKEAQKLSIEAGLKRKKRKNMEHAYSATLILQRYIDNNA